MQRNYSIVRMFWLRALTTFALFATLVVLDQSPAQAETTRCTGPVSSDIGAAKRLYNASCGGSYSWSSGLHRCDWTPAGWRCLGPRGSSSPTQPEPDTTAATCNGSVRFEDTFSGSRLDANKWKTGFYWDGEGQLTNAGGGQQQQYVTSLTDQVFDVNPDRGSLIIRPRQSGSKYYSGSLTAQQGDQNQTFGKGCFEIRAKFPDGLGAFPAFWMIANNGPDWNANGTRSDDARPEIDVIETIGQPDVFFTSAHHLGDQNNHLLRTDPDNSWHRRDVTESFHTFSARWSENGIRWYYDGVEVYHTDRPAQVDSMFLHLNYALAGGWAQNVDDSFFTPQAPAFEVDYVKVTS